MLKRTLFFLFFTLSTTFIVYAQTADDIVESYLAAIGGKEKLKELKTLKMLSLVKAQGMDIPAELLKKAPDKMKITLNFQGYEMVQPAFDGKNGWSTNFMTMENEMMDPDGSAAMKVEAQDFPDPFYEYESKNYKISREENQTEGGKEYFVILLSKNSLILNGEEIPNEAHYYFDKKTFLPYKKVVFTESGPSGEMSIESIYSNYKEVKGIQFPFTIEQKINDVVQAVQTIEAIDTNLIVEDSEFVFPE